MSAEKKDLVALNFTVPPEFRQEYKVTAAELGVSMVEILKESFALFKQSKALKQGAPVRVKGGPDDGH